MNTATIVQKLWNYCNVLRDDLSACGHAQAGGMSYGDYPSASLRAGSEQLTYLLFLKMADEPVCVRTRTGRRTQTPYNQKGPLPEIDWP